ncbi:hypothetical protein H8E88_11150 [candidate division KSB1 bacterium]|nr:hypothetical protein [candidate division KSB1 bacterium]MBL7093009.1 hypothetical protein [candidate division KSB1 bacterium]
MENVEAIAIDERHLELEQPLPKNIGKRFIIHILSKEEERSSQLAELEHAYLTMTEHEKKTEVDLAEEGLCGNDSLDEIFKGEKEERWWE